MKKFLILFLTVTLILGIFISCDKASHNDTSDTTDDIPSEQTSKETTADATTDTTEETTEETTEPITTESEKVDLGYTIEKIDGQYYIVCDSYNVDNHNVGITMPSPVQYIGADGPISLSCNSVENIKNKFYSLTYSELNSIKRTWERDENGIPIIDLDNLYSLILPTGVEYFRTEYITIYQHSYEFDIVYDHALQGWGLPDGRLKMLTSEEYDAYIDEINNDNIEVTILTQDDKDVRFCVDYDEFDIYSYYGIIKSNDVYAQFTLSTLEELDDNFFLQFDFEKYEG